MLEAQENKPKVIASTHLKGGCGKTTVLTDLGVVMAMNGYKVLAVDTDMQGSMFHTLTGQPPKLYLPSHRENYIADLQNGESMKAAQSSIPEVNANVTVAHFPMEMFYKDGYSKPEYKQTFAKIMAEQAQSTKAILIDMPPARLAGEEADPFKIAEPFVDEFIFLITSRPNPQEVINGVACYESLKELMIMGKIDPDKIRPLFVLNFVPILGKDMDYTLVNMGGHLIPREQGRHVIASSPFSDLDEEELPEGAKIPRVQIPNISNRGGENMRHYSMLLDQGIRLRRLLFNELEDWEGDPYNELLISGGNLDILGKMWKQENDEEPYKPYIEAINSIVEQVLPPRYVYRFDY